MKLKDLSLLTMISLTLVIVFFIYGAYLCRALALQVQVMVTFIVMGYFWACFWFCLHDDLKKRDEKLRKENPNYELMREMDKKTKEVLS